MANRHPLILDSEGIIRELSSSEVIDLVGNTVIGSNRIDTKSLRIVNDSEVIFALPQNRGYFGQTLVSDSQGNVEWQALDTVQYTDSELLFAFNNSISELNHDYISADSDQLMFIVGEFIAADAQLKNEIEDGYQTADLFLQNQIDAEVVNRQNADSTLQSNIDTVSSELTTETNARVSNVQSLLALVQLEIANRQSADSDLRVQLTSITDEADSDIVALIENEVANRFSNDSDLSALVANIPLPQFVQECDEFTATANQTTFTLSQTPNGKVAMFRNSVRIRPTAISVSGNIVTYNAANNTSIVMEVGDVVVCDYIRSI